MTMVPCEELCLLVGSTIYMPRVCVQEKNTILPPSKTEHPTERSVQLENK